MSFDLSQKRPKCIRDVREFPIFSVAERLEKSRPNLNAFWQKDPFFLGSDMAIGPDCMLEWGHF